MRSNRALLLVVLAAILGAGGLYFLFGRSNTVATEHLPIVAITQIATHPALDEVRAGIIAGLAKRGFIDGKTIRIIFRNAGGDASLTVAIAQDFVRQGATVIVPISTPSTLAIAKATDSIPIVFSGVTDPVSTGLVAHLDHPGGNITGVSDRWPFEAQVRTYLKYFPNTKRIGMIYTQGDDVAKIGVDALTQLAPKLGFQLILRPVSSAQDIYPTALALFPNVDVIYTGIDHLILENIDGLVKASNEMNRPLFGGESGSVEKGAVMALSINMTEFGDLTADLVAKVLRGAKPGDIPVNTVTTGQLLVNSVAARHFGLNPDALARQGAKIINVPSGQ